MRRIGALILFLAIAIPARCEDWTTSDGKVYKDVVVVAAEDDGVRIKYDGGVGKIPYFQLPDDLLKRFGKDAASLAAKKAADEKAAADAAMKAEQQAAELKKEQEEAAAAQAAMNPAPPSSATSKPGASSSSSSSSSSAAAAAAAASSAAAHPSQPGVNPTPGNTGGESAPPPPFSPTAVPTEENPYPHSKFQYNEGQDLCDLDSYPVNLAALILDASPTAPQPTGPGGTLFLRIETEGHRAEAPDIVTGIFASTVSLKKLPDNHKVKFLVDGAFIQGGVNPDENDVNLDRTSLALQVNFTLTPDQAKTIANGKNVNVSFGDYTYRIDDAGLAILRGYQVDVDRLPPPSTNLMRSYHRFVNRLPSIITMISTTCEYIILGAFAIVVVASIAAFIMGLTRFIKM